jgi:hypothetical protein
MQRSLDRDRFRVSSLITIRGVVIVSSVLLVSIVALAFIRPGADKDESLTALSVGDCITSVKDGYEEIDVVRVTSCSKGHEAELMSVVAIEQEGFPTYDEANICSLPETLNGVNLKLKIIVPGQRLWNSNFHKVLCFAMNAEGYLLQSPLTAKSNPGGG